jgi:hypothetical protein
MPRRSTNLFAILVIPKSVQRDKRLSEILGKDIDEYKNKKYIGSGNRISANTYIYFTGDFSTVKTWKTHKGCQNFLDKVVLRSGAKYELGYSDYDDGLDFNNPVYIVSNINADWNSYIEKKIEKETKKYKGC